ncbi:predicted protein [Naegleria gruberi]|uniref:Predicted protein n=1 Tax=Naegleria gruberi TaxID=5762 RepID=D2V5U4_NAEGR|nr:uncharacterized protein NAEGRDRAFT_46908 [Naegleria gruberi]EFC47856.1 predicted protein [Naegleria gruberi]|eukprot:XP_002680600.1 predicted protein [Naegleria gruberi strain NEG-M]
MCNLSNYLWRSDDDKQVSIIERTPMKSSKVNESFIIDCSPPTTVLLNKPSTTTIIPTSDETLVNRSPSTKRKVDAINVKELSKKAVKAIKTDNEQNDYTMSETSLLLQELTDILSDREERDALKRKVELEEGFYEYCMQFYQKIITENKKKMELLENQFGEIEALSIKVSSYITKRREKLEIQDKIEHAAIKEELKKLFAEEK